MITKLRQVEHKEVVCAAAVFSLFLFLKFILFCLLGEYFVSVCAKAARIAYGIINKRGEVGQFIYFLMTLLELLLGRSLHNNLRSQAEKFMAVTDENEATDFGVTADVGDVMRTTYWVPEDNTVHHMGDEVRNETLTIVI